MANWIFSAIRHRIGYNLAESWKCEPIKKESTLLDALAKFRKEDGIYMHEKADEEGSAMATYQAMIALEAVQKLRTEKEWIFDFK